MRFWKKCALLLIHFLSFEWSAKVGLCGENSVKERINVKAPTLGGMMRIEGRDRQGRRTLQYQNAGNGRFVKGTYSPLGSLESTEEWTPGLLLEQRYYDSDSFEMAVFLPTYFRETVARMKSGAQRVDLWRRDGAGVNAISYLRASEGANACLNEVSPTVAERLASDFNRIEMTEDASGRLQRRMSQQYTFETTGCDQYANGTAGLVRDLEDALNIGFSCLSGKGPMGDLGTRAKIDAARIRLFLESRTVKPPFITCLRNKDMTNPTNHEAGHAIVCPAKDAPGVQINLEKSATFSRSERSALLFHEMMHWLGDSDHLHFEGVDLVYLTQHCCFGKRNPDACQTIRDTDPGVRRLGSQPALKFSSPLYIERISRLMSSDHRDLVDKMAWSSLRDAGRTPDGRLDASSLYAGAIEPRESPGWGTLTRIVFANAAAGNIPGISREQAMREFDRYVTSPSYPAGIGANDAKKAFAQTLGVALAAALNKDLFTMIDQIKNAEKSREGVCAKLDSTEKNELNQVGKAVSGWLNSIPATLRDLLRDPCKSESRWKIRLNRLFPTVF